MSSTLFAHEIGEGFPTLIIHGWHGDGLVEQLDFEPIFSKNPGFRRIYVDLPGMGKTPANNVKDMDEIYHRLVGFVDHRLGGSRFAVAGSSCGGYLARAIAQKYKDQVDGLLLRVPLIEPEDSKRDLDAFEPLVANKKFMDTLTEEDRLTLGNVPVQTPAYTETLKAKLKDGYHRTGMAFDLEVLDPIRVDPKRYSLSFSLDDASAKLLAPTLIISGRHDDVVGYRDSLRLLELYPRSTFAVLDRGTHGIPIDETGVFDALVKDWIIRINEWRSRPEES